MEFFYRLHDLVTHVDPYTLLANSLPLPLKLGKYSTTIIGQIPIHLFIHETWKRSCDGCAITNSLLWPITVGLAITAVTRMNTPEWLSLQSLPVSPLAWLSVWDLAVTRDWERVYQEFRKLFSKKKLLSCKYMPLTLKAIQSVAQYTLACLL